MFTVAIFLSILWGTLVAVQGPTNASLGKIVGGAQSSLISFSTGTALSTIIVIFFGSGNFSHITTASFWQLLGGAYGAAVVFGTIVSVPILGVALTMTALVLGQLFSGMVIDSLGLFGTALMPPSPLRIIGFLFAISGLTCIYIDKKSVNTKPSSPSKKSDKRMPLCVTLMFCAGAGASVQAPTNASLAVIIGKLEATLVSFIGGVIILFFLTMIFNKGKLNPVKGVKSWQLLGGFYGFLGVLFSIIATPNLGVVLTMSGVMLGQLFFGTIVDTFGFFDSQKLPLGKLRIIGVILFILCICITAAATA